MKKINITPSVMTVVVNIQKTILTVSPGVGLSESAATKDGGVLSRETGSFWEDEEY